MIRRTLSLIVIVLSAAQLFGQNYYGEPYDHILKHLDFFNRKNSEPDVETLKTPNSIRLLISGTELEDIEYTFVDSICTGISMRFSCEGCFDQIHEKRILTGRWKSDGNGDFHSLKRDCTVRISSIDDPEYCISVEVGKLAITREVYKKL